MPVRAWRRTSVRRIGEGMGILRFIRKTPGIGLALPALIALLGLLFMFVAPPAYAASTYDIKDVGYVHVTSITTNGRTFNGSLNGMATTGVNAGANGVSYILTLQGRIEDMSTLGDGDNIFIPFSSDKGSHCAFAPPSGPSELKDEDGNALFKVSHNATNLVLTRTDAPASGLLDFTWTSSANNAYRDGSGWDSLNASKSVWHVSGDTIVIDNNVESIGIDNTYWTNTPGWADVSTGGGHITAANVMNAGTVNRWLNGGERTGDPRSLVTFAHITPDEGTTLKVDSAQTIAAWNIAYDATHCGKGVINWFSVDYQDRTADRVSDSIHSYADAVKHLPKAGQWSAERNDDGSWDAAINTGGDYGDNALTSADPSTWDGNTNKLIDAANKAGLAPQTACGDITVRFGRGDVAQSATVTATYGRAGDAAKTRSYEIRNLAQGSSSATARARILYDPNAETTGATNSTVGEPESRTTASANGYARVGYAFDSWNTKADGKGTAYRPGDAVVYPAKGRTLTLYAQWKPITYTIRFDGNKATSGMMADLTATYDAKATLPANRYAKSGKAFTGWNTKPDGSGATCKNRGEVTNLASTEDVIVLYAQWTNAMTTMPETGGTMNHRRLTTMLGGGACPYGPSSRPHAQAQAGLTRARRVM